MRGVGLPILAASATLGALASIPTAGHQIPAVLFFSTLCVLSVIDWRTRYLPDPLQRIAYVATAAEATGQVLSDHPAHAWQGPVVAWSVGVLGGLALFGLARRTGQLGLGDVKLAGSCGAWLALTCPGQVGVALVVMALVGAASALACRGRAFAYGPAITLGTYAAALAHVAVV